MIHEQPGTPRREAIQFPIRDPFDAVELAESTREVHPVGDTRRTEQDASIQDIIRNGYAALPGSDRLLLLAQVSESSTLRETESWQALADELQGRLGDVEALPNMEEMNNASQLAVIATAERGHLDQVLRESMQQFSGRPLLHHIVQLAAEGNLHRNGQQPHRRIAPHTVAQFDDAGHITAINDQNPRRALYDSTVSPFYHDHPVADSVTIFEQLHSPRVDEYITDRIGVAFDRLPLMVKVPLSRWLLNANEQRWNTIEQVVQRGDVDMEQLWKAMATAAADARMGDELLEYATTADPEEMQQLLAQSNHVIAQAERIGENIGQFFKKQQHAQRLERAGEIFPVRELLRRTARELRNAIRGKSNALQRAQTDTIITAALTSVALRKNYDIQLEDLTRTLSRTEGIITLDENTTQQIREILAQHYPQEHPIWKSVNALFEPQTPEDQQRAESSTVHVLEYAHPDRIDMQAVMVVERIDENTVRLIHLATNSSYQKTGLGEPFAMGVLNMYRGTNTVEGRSREASLQYYLNKGFEIDATQTTEDTQGTLYGLIMRPNV